MHQQAPHPQLDKINMYHNPQPHLDMTSISLQLDLPTLNILNLMQIPMLLEHMDLKT